MEKKEKMKESIAQFLNLFGLELNLNNKPSDEKVFEINWNKEPVGTAILLNNQGKIYAAYENVELFATYEETKSWKKDIIKFDIKDNYNGTIEVRDRNPFFKTKGDIQLVSPTINFEKKGNYNVTVRIQQESMFRILLEDKTKKQNEDISISFGLLGMFHRIKYNEDDKETFVTSSRYDRESKKIWLFDGNEEKTSTYEIDSLNCYSILKEQAKLLAATDKSYYKKIDWLRKELKIGEISIFDNLIRMLYQEFPEDTLEEILGYNVSQDKAKINIK